MQSEKDIRYESFDRPSLTYSHSGKYIRLIKQ